MVSSGHRPESDVTTFRAAAERVRRAWRRVVGLSWAGSNFAALFEVLAIELLNASSQSTVAQLLRQAGTKCTGSCSVQWSGVFAC